MTFKEIDIPQGSPEWLEWRKTGITATDISVIIRSNPYSTPLKLWKEKRGLVAPPSVNKAMQHGIDSEPKAREWINKTFDLKIKPICVQSIDEPCFIASLDGYDSKEKVLVEIKAPTTSNSLDSLKNEHIPLYWQTQIQWQMMLTKPQSAFLGAWDFRINECQMLYVHPDLEYQQTLKKAALVFMEHLKNGTKPPSTEHVYQQVSDEILSTFLREYLDADSKEKIATKRKKILKERIVKFHDKDFTCDGFYMTKRSTTRFNRKKAEQDLGSLKKYDETSEPHWTIKLPT